ncbi:MAG: glycosyltransferase [Candidatus Hydrogenedens sp.]|nr:glycosyltransferase [Candidatus Hydrogenedens sp.]
MKILFLTENYPPETNAAATRVHERAIYWVRNGHQVTVLTSAPNFPLGKVFPGYQNRWYDVRQHDGVRVIRVKTFMAANDGFLLRTLDFLSFMASAFVAGLFQSRPDVVMATSPQFFTAVGAWALTAVRRLPFVFELGDLWPRSIVAVGAMAESPTIRLLERLELFLYRRARAVVALTNAFKEDLVRRGIPAEKIAVVINGVDLPRYQPQPRDAALATEWQLTGKFVIGYVGTHGMAHGLTNVLDAAERLQGDDRIRFLLAGAGAERQLLIDSAAARGLSNVVFMPMQPKEAMPRVWSLCDVALVHLKDSPAFAEVIPSKIFEAMGMGLPILLVAPPGEASRIVSGAAAGRWVPAGDPDALAAAAVALMTDDAGRARLAATSHAAAARFTRQRQAEHVIEVLDRVLAGSQSMVVEA